jgi:hypothetical protein
MVMATGHRNSSTRTLQRYVSNTAKEHKEAMDRNEKRIMSILAGADGSEGLATKTSRKLSPELSPELSHARAVRKGKKSGECTTA